MTKREIAEVAQDCLRNIIDSAEANLHYDIGDNDLDDVISDAECAAEDISACLGELQVLLAGVTE